jgi:ketosteroid isomerase-like protein
MAGGPRPRSIDLMAYRSTAAGMAVAILLAGPASAQVLPFPQEPRSGLDNARYVLEVRTELERVLQEWVNAWERSDAAAVSRFYTDQAILVGPTAETVRGREALAEYWAGHRAGGQDLVAAITHVSATNTMATARARIGYRAGSGSGSSRTGDMLLVFERQRGLWMLRVHAIAMDAPAGSRPVASLPRAIRATGREARVPEVPQLRWRAEPFAGSLRFHEAFATPSAGIAGLGLGLEAGRVAELRVGFWQGVAGAGDRDLQGLTGEVRLFGFPDRVVRPYVLAGAARLAGRLETGRLGGASGAGAVVPMAGAGLAMELPGRWGAHLDGRSLLMVDPAARPAAHWINEERVASWSFSAGASYSVGRAREWRDPPVTAVRQEYEERVQHDLAILMGQWLNGARADGDRRAGGLYAPDARLITPDGHQLHGPEISRFWAGRPPIASGSLIYEDLRASGHLATLVARIVPPGHAARPDEAAAAALVTVFEQANGAWAIRSQMLLAGDPERAGP